MAAQISIKDARQQLLEAAGHLETLAENEERGSEAHSSKPNPQSEVQTLFRVFSRTMSGSSWPHYDT